MIVNEVKAGPNKVDMMRERKMKMRCPPSNVPYAFFRPTNTAACHPAMLDQVEIYDPRFILNMSHPHESAPHSEHKVPPRRCVILPAGQSVVFRNAAFQVVSLSSPNVGKVDPFMLMQVICLSSHRFFESRRSSIARLVLRTGMQMGQSLRPCLRT